MKTTHIMASVAVALLAAATAYTAVPRDPAVAPNVVVAMPMPKLLELDLAQLRAEVGRVRTSDPVAFTQVASIEARAKELDATRRGPYAPMTPLFKALGKRALMPLLEGIALRPERADPDLTPTARLALRVGRIEAVGMLRDPRAVPVLEAVLDGDDDDFEIVRATSEALGASGDVHVAERLVSRAATRSTKQRAIVAGMGTSRHLVVARALAGAVEAHPAGDMALALVGALGDVGSSWAWSALAKDAAATTPSSAGADEASVRETAARGLVAAYVAYGGQVRKAASDALMMVDAPQTPSLIMEAKARGGDAAALDSLAARFAENPTR